MRAKSFPSDKISSFPLELVSIRDGEEGADRCEASTGSWPSPCGVGGDAGDSEERVATLRRYAESLAGENSAVCLFALPAFLRFALGLTNNELPPGRSVSFISRAFSESNPTSVVSIERCAVL